MGVPLLLTWLRTHYKSCFTAVQGVQTARVTPTTSPLPQPTSGEELEGQRGFDHLHIDLNSILYQAASMVMMQCSAADTTESIEDGILKKVVTLLDDLLYDVCDVHKLVFIAVDGVSPVGKIAQQRRRRLTSRRRPDSRWDLNSITSGTVFMAQRIPALLSWYTASRAVRMKQKKGRELTFIVSDSSVPGEGEQKIVEFIRDHRDAIVATGGAAALAEYEKETHCVCSNDTDVIVASLSLHLPHMTVLRYSPESPSNSMFFSILKFRRCLFERFGRPTIEAFERSLHDLMFVLLLFGSDFLAALPWMEIAAGQLDQLMDFLASDFIVRGKNLVDPVSGVMDCEAVVYFLKYVHDSDVGGGAGGTEGAAAEADIGTKRSRGGLSIVFGASGGDSANAFDANAQSNPHGGKVKTTPEVVDAYWEGLQWMMYYQCQPCRNWGWTYKHTAVPTLEELTERCSVSTVGHIISDPIPLIAQLLLVLPSESNHLLPTCIQSSYAEVFAPLLVDTTASLDIDAVVARVERFTPLLTKEERERTLTKCPYLVRFTPQEREATSTGNDDVAGGKKGTTTTGNGTEEKKAVVVVSAVTTSVLNDTVVDADGDGMDLLGLDDDDLEDAADDAIALAEQQAAKEAMTAAAAAEAAAANVDPDAEEAFLGMQMKGREMVHSVLASDRKANRSFGVDLAVPASMQLERWNIPEMVKSSILEMKKKLAQAELVLAVDPALVPPTPMAGEEGPSEEELAKAAKRQRQEEDKHFQALQNQVQGIFGAK